MAKLSKLSPWERETLVCFNEGEEECVICTASPRVAERLRRAGLEPDPGKPGADSSWRFRVTKYALRVKVGRRSVLLGGRPRRATGVQGE